MGKIRNRTLQDYGRFAEAGALLALAKLIVALAPFRAITAMASWQRSGSGRVTNEEARSTAIALAVRRASRRLPMRCVCIHEGLAAQWMLRRRGIPALLHYGLRQAEDRLTAHVWVTLNGLVLIGEEETGRHACVATFPEISR